MGEARLCVPCLKLPILIYGGLQVLIISHIPRVSLGVFDTVRRYHAGPCWPSLAADIFCLERNVGSAEQLRFRERGTRSLVAVQAPMNFVSPRSVGKVNNHLTPFTAATSRPSSTVEIWRSSVCLRNFGLGTVSAFIQLQAHPSPFMVNSVQRHQVLPVSLLFVGETNYAERPLQMVLTLIMDLAL